VNLSGMLLGASRTAPDSVALVSEAGTSTYGTLGSEVRAAAGGLRQLGVAPGDRVAIVAGNEAEFVVVYLATLHAGAVAVPLNPTAAPVELARELEDVDAEIAVIDRSGVAAFEASGAALPAVGARCELARPAGTWDELRGADEIPEPVERADDDLAVLLYTAGTAGAPKAAMLTHGNLVASIRQIQEQPELRIEPRDVGLAALPLFHIYGLNTGLGVAMTAGASQVLVRDFDPAATLRTMRDEKATIVAGVPAMYEMWCDAARDAEGELDDAFATVRLVLSGAAPLPEDLAERVKERFGTDIYEGYGLTEASPVVTTGGVGSPPRPGSVGPAIDGVEVRLVDSDGADVLHGDPGEIWVRGPNVFPGYWRDPEATATVLTDDGWLRTGDIAVADADGWLSIVNRAKDLIIVSGFNVYPGEVEDVLVEHPDVDEAAVVGAPDTATGEAVVAFVAPVEGTSPSVDDLRAFCKERIARYKVPSRIEVVDDFPRSLAGKVLRRALREMAESDDPATRNPA